MIDATVTLERSADGRLGWLRFSSAHQANVLTTPMLEQLLAAVREVRDDATMRVLVVMGREDVFSGGADLEMIRAFDDETYRHYIATEYRLFAELEALPVITLAAMAGPCIGNATELALACDFRLCTADVRLGLPEMRVGFVTPAQRLTAHVGIGVAKELAYLGRLLGADEAKAHGLVTTVADDGLVAAAEKEADRYARVAPFALPYTKAGVNRCYGLGGRFDADEQEAAYATFRSQDFQEGADAALAGRRPEFSGR